MSNKNLLNESTIRKFMKLANMEPLAEEFVSTHLQTEDEEVELEEANDEEIEEGVHEKEEEEKVDEMGGYMGKHDDGEPHMGKDDMGDEDPMGDDPIDDEDMGDMGDMEDMGGDAEVTLDEEDVQALKSALEAAQSVMDKLAGGLGGDEEEMPMDDEDEDPMGNMGEPEMNDPAMDDPAGRDEMMEEEDLGIDLVDENELVAEVLKKVVNKLAKKG